MITHSVWRRGQHTYGLYDFRLVWTGEERQEKKEKEESKKGGGQETGLI
jgi:hypothetical protein